jgi:hypothetical protein
MTVNSILTKDSKLGSSVGSKKHWFYFVPKTNYVTQHFTNRNLAQDAKKGGYLLWTESVSICIICQHI